jgi:hypothetical protein
MKATATVGLMLTPDVAKPDILTGNATLPTERNAHCAAIQA